MENTETGNDTSVWNKAVEQITKGYRPPCFKVLMNLSEKPENLLEITVWEMMACKQMLKCKYRMLTELNMKTKMYRILSATLYKPDGTIVNIPEGAWDYIVPETNTETLYSLLKLRKPNTKKP
jgi:hypothetical protein